MNVSVGVLGVGSVQKITSPATLTIGVKGEDSYLIRYTTENIGVRVDGGVGVKVTLRFGAGTTGGGTIDIADADTLDGYHAEAFARKAEAAHILEAWRFLKKIGIGFEYDEQIEAYLHNNYDSILNGPVLVGDYVRSRQGFVEGFSGYGWEVDRDGNMTIESLVVRKALKVYELIINQIRATNGSLWVSDSAEILTATGNTANSYLCRIDSDKGNIAAPFVDGDIVRCQRWTGRGIKYYTGVVLSVSSDTFVLEVIDGTDTPEAKDPVVRIGNRTDSNRQGALYLTASDEGAPYMDVMDGVTDASFAGKIKARLGKLSGLNYKGKPLSGYGLFAELAYLTGAIRNANGKWELNEDGSGSLASGAITWTAAGVLTITGVPKDVSDAINNALTKFIDEDFAQAIQNINTQLDKKAETFYQTGMPHAEFVGIDTNAQYDIWVNDMWYNSDPAVKKSYLYVKKVNANNAAKVDYVWAYMDIPKELFDQFDGKKTIYTTKPSKYAIDDIWITESDTIHSKYKKGEILVSGATRAAYQESDWVAKVRYTDDSVANSKNTRFLTVDDPALTNTLKVGDEWIREEPDGEGGTYAVSYIWDGDSWEANKTVIDGGRITTGIVDAARIDVDALLAKEVTAQNLHVQTGSIGNFKIASSLLGISGTNILGLDPTNREIYIEKGGNKTVSIKDGLLTPILLFPTSDHIISSSLKVYTSNPVSKNTLASNPVKVLYLGQNSGTLFAGTAVPTSAQQFQLGSSGKQISYSVNVPFELDIVHSMQKTDGRFHKLKGTLNLVVTAELYIDGVISGNSIQFPLVINLDSYEGINRTYAHQLRTNVTVDGVKKAYWKLSIAMSGNMRYQYYTHSTWFRSSSWTDMNSTNIEYRFGIGPGFNFSSSVAITEIANNGIQAYWGPTRYFRVDGNDGAAFIRSAGTWMHNGYEVATSNNINQITANLSNYVLGEDLINAYYNRLQSDDRYVKLTGGNSISGAQTITGDLTVVGNITQSGSVYTTHAEQVFSKNDFIVLRDGNTGGLASGAVSGFKIMKANGTTNVVLGTGNDAIARVGWEGGSLQAIATREDSPLNNGIAHWDVATSKFITRASALDSDKLGGVNATSYARRDLSNLFLKSQVIAHSTTSNVFGSGGLQIQATYSTVFGSDNSLCFCLNSTPIAGIAGIYSGWGSTNGSAGHLLFYTKNEVTESTPTVKMVITKQGNVGINTAYPSEKLEVAGNIKSSAAVIVKNTHAASSNLFANTGGAGFYIHDGTGQKIRFGNYGDNFIGYNLSINKTTAANEALEVEGNVLVNGCIRTDVETVSNNESLIGWDRWSNSWALKKYQIHTGSSIHYRWEVGNGANGWTTTMRFDHKGKVKIGSNSIPTEVLDIAGNIKVSGKGLFGSDLETTSVQFGSGFVGQGWKLEAATNHLTVDKLTVRKELKVYELIVDQVRAQRGAIVVSPGSAKIESATVSRAIIDTDNGRLPISVKAGDKLRIQRFTGNGSKYLVVNVTAVGANYFDYTVIDGTGTLASGDEVVVFGSDDPTRQGLMYITASDDGAPYMDVLDGVNTHIHTTPRNIRYIRDWLNGSSVNDGNHWIEIKALNSAGVNIAQGKTVTGLNSQKAAFPYSRITDGVLTDWAGSAIGTGLEWVRVDLGSIQEIDKIQVWHYYPDGRTYYKTKTEVSVDGVTWYPIFDSAVQGTYPETAAGRTYTLGAGKTRLRVGKLSGISGQSGYGIWGSQDGVNEAFAISSAGYARIFGWNIGHYQNDAKQPMITSPNGKLGIYSHLTSSDYNYIAVGKSNWLDTPNQLLLGQQGSFIGIKGTSGGNVAFQLDLANNQHKIATWNFDEDSMWSGVKWGTGTYKGLTLRGGSSPLIIASKSPADYVYLKNASDTDYGIGGFLGGVSIFQLGSTNHIAGCKFDAGSIWSGNDKANASWRLNADGSGHFGGGKFTFDGEGNAILDKTLTAQTLIGEVLQSSNWISSEGTMGVKFSLDTGEILFGNSMSIDAEDGIINVKNKDTMVTGVKIGDFDLTPLNSGGTSISTNLTGSAYTVGNDYGTYTGSVSGSGAISSSTTTILSNSFIVNGIYFISASLKFSFAKESLKGTFQMLDQLYEGDVFGINATLSIQILDANNVVLKTKFITINRTYYSSIVEEGLGISETIKATTSTLKMRFSISGGASYKYYRQGDIDQFGNVEYFEDRYSTRCTVTPYNSLSKLLIKPNTSITELSARGFQSLWGSNKYFKLYDNPLNSSDPFIWGKGNMLFESGGNGHSIKLDDLGFWFTAANLSSGNRLIQIKYGTFTSNSDNAISTLFTTPFANTCLIILTDEPTGRTVNKDRYGFTTDRLDTVGETCTRHYIAIGY